MIEGRLKEYPVDSGGELLHRVLRGAQPTWVPNEPFRATMRYQGHRKGTSAILFYLHSEGRAWHMLLADFDWLIQNARISKGEVSGVWKVRKRSQMYGLEWLGK